MQTLPCVQKALYPLSHPHSLKSECFTCSTSSYSLISKTNDGARDSAPTERRGARGNVPWTGWPTVSRQQDWEVGFLPLKQLAPGQEAKLQGGQRSGNFFWITLGNGMSPPSNPSPTGQPPPPQGIWLPALSWISAAGMFLWFSCWNSMKSAFILSAVSFWSWWGAESGGIPKPSPPSLPTASRHLISVEAQTGAVTSEQQH